MRAALALLLAALAAGPAGADGYVRLEGHGGPIRGLAVSGERVLTASFDYAVGLWDGGSGAELARLEGHDAAANAAVFTPDGAFALTAADDHDLILWDLGTGGALARLSGHRGKVMGVAIAPGGDLAASASWDGTVRLWSLPDGAPVAVLEGHRAGVNDVAFAPDGAYLFSASQDGTIRRWRRDGTFGRIESKHGFGVNRVVVGPQGTWLAYGAVDGYTRAIDLDTGETLGEVFLDRRPILGFALSPSGGRLATGDGEGFLTVIDTGTWRVERDFRAALRGPVWALAFLGEDRLVTAGIEDSAAIWPLGAKGPVFAEDAPRAFHRDPETMSNGERQFMRKCAVCHSLTPDGGRRAGPSLHGVFGRKAGSLPGYAYSDAVRGAPLIWSAETIDRLFQEGPEVVTPGSKMPMQRIARPEDRADLIAWLRAASDPTGGEPE